MKLSKVTIMFITGATLLLGGCFENDRPLSHNKGVYAGKADEKLTPDQVEELRQRSLVQGQ